MILQAVILSFSGYLILGNINMGIFELSAAHKYTLSITLLLIAVVVEFLYAWFLLGNLHYLHDDPGISQITSIAVFLVFLGLGIWNILHKPRTEKAHHNSLVQRALFATFVHPQQVPYWIVWGSYFASRGLDLHDSTLILGMALGTAAGAALSLSLFVVLAKRMVAFSQKYSWVFGKIIGALCLVLALNELVGWLGWKWA